MFEIDGDLILFEGNPVARFEPSAWPSLRAEVEGALDGYDPEASSEEAEEIDRLEAELRDARSDIKAYVREIAALEGKIEELEGLLEAQLRSEGA